VAEGTTANRKNENDGGLKRHVYEGGGRYTERGHIVGFRHAPGQYTYAAADLTKAYTGKVREVTRQFLYLRGQQEFFVVFDRVEASNARFPKHFMLHLSGDPKITGTETVKTAGHVIDYKGDGMVSTWESSTEKENGVTSQGKSRIFMKTLLPAGAVITKRGGSGHEHWGHPLESTAQYNHTGRGRDNAPVSPWRLEVAAPLGTARQYFLHVFFVTDGQGPMPETTAMLGGGSVTVKIDGAPRKYEVSFGLSGATSAKVSCKGGGGYDASLAPGIDVSAQTAVEQARAAGKVAARAAVPKAGGGAAGAPAGSGGSGGRLAELFSKAKGLEESGNILGAEALYKRITEDGKDTKYAALASDRLKAMAQKLAEAKKKQAAGADLRKAKRYFTLAENMLKAENYDAAKVYYMRIIKQFPNSDYAAQALERLEDLR